MKTMQPKLNYPNKTNPSYLCLFSIENVKKLAYFCEIWRGGNHIFRENGYIDNFAAMFPADIFKTILLTV